MRKEDQNNFCIFTTALDYIEHNLCSEFTQEDIAAVLLLAFGTSEIVEIRHAYKP